MTIHLLVEATFNDEDDILVLNSTNGVLNNDVDVDGDVLSSESKMYQESLTSMAMVH